MPPPTGEEYDTEGESELSVLSDATMAFIMSIAGNQNVISQMSSPADLYIGEEGLDPNEAAQLPSELLSSPVTPAEMPYIMNRLSTRSPELANRALFSAWSTSTPPRCACC